ncbi:MAG: hemerythrin domain-containing protein [Burkholderiales bacterium]|nr:hemerythrin domain-containing protein [Burkholderiales bacterium]
MIHSRQTAQMLHDEHRAHLDLLAQVEAVFGARQADLASRLALVRSLRHQLDHETQRHFDFEERELFSRLAEAGDSDIAELLREEHDAMRALAEELRPLSAAALDGSLDAAGWDALRRAALEMVERQVSHIQKESMALLPRLDDLLDEDTDRELAFAYASL